MRASLRPLADPEKAKAGQRFFKHPVSMMGVDASALHRLARDYRRELRPVWGVGDVVKLCDILMRDRVSEPGTIGMLILAGFDKEYTPRLLPVIKRWLRNRCTSWGFVDTLVPAV